MEEKQEEGRGWWREYLSWRSSLATGHSQPQFSTLLGFKINGISKLKVRAEKKRKMYYANTCSKKAETDQSDVTKMAE